MMRSTRCLLIVTLLVGLFVCGGAFVPGNVVLSPRIDDDPRAVVVVVVVAPIHSFRGGLLSPGRRWRPLLDHSRWRVFYESSAGVNELLSSNSTSREDVQRLLQRAKELRTEARTMEVALEETKSSSERRKETDVQVMMNHLFHSNRPLTPQAAARILREERWSEEQLVLLLEALYQRRKKASAPGTPRTPVPQETSKVFQIADTSNAAPVLNQTELDLVEQYVDCIIDAAAILDAETASGAAVNRRWSGRAAPALKSRLKQWERSDEKDLARRLVADVRAAIRQAGNASVEEYMRRTLGLEPEVVAKQDSPSQFNVTRVVERVIMVPMWVPSSLLDLLVATRHEKVNSTDVRTIKDRVLATSRFFCTSSESIPSAAVFRGNIRPPPDGDTGGAAPVVERNFSSVVFQDIQRRMDREGLSERIQLFLLQDPEWRPDRDERDGNKPKPVLLALPKAAVPMVTEGQQSLATTIAKRASVFLTFLTTFSYSLSCYALNPSFFRSIVEQNDMTVLVSCLPVFVGLLALQGVHELAHFIVARRRGIKLSLPLPLPSPQLGTFGCITKLLSFPSDRTAMMDFALSGPVTTMLVSIFFMLTGAHQTIYASSAALTNFPFVPLALLKSSFLSGSILTMLLPKAMMMPLSQPIPIHPLFVVGYASLLASALNLLPLFRLDGGRACTAAVGSRVGAIVSVWTLLCMLSLALSGSGLAWAWGAMVLFFQRRPDIPVRDEVTPVDNIRIWTWIASLITAVLALVPFPGGPGFL